MGCGLSKSSDSDSPQQKRRRGSKRSNSSIVASDGSSDETNGAEVPAADGKKSKLRAPVSATPVLNQTKVLSADQLEFFRRLDQKIEEGKDLDPSEAEKETRQRMELLLRHWDEVIHSRPGTTRPRPSSLASNYSSLMANGAVSRGAPLPPAAEGAEDAPPRLERNLRSSRRSMRSARADSTEEAPAAAPAGQLDDSQLVSKLIQLGDAYVHDLDADDPDGFVRLGRRSSTYEEPAILEESEAAHARGEYGRSSLALRTMIHDSSVR